MESGSEVGEALDEIVDQWPEICIVEDELGQQHKLANVRWDLHGRHEEHGGQVASGGVRVCEPSMCGRGGSVGINECNRWVVRREDHLVEHRVVTRG